MFSRIDKAWVSGAVAFLSMSAFTFFGITVDPTVQAGLTGFVISVMTYLVPNKT